MAYTQIDAITRQKFVPKLEDNILDDCPTLRYLFMDTTPENGGGQKLVVPVKKSTNAAGGSYGRGDVFDVTAPSTRDTFEFDWKQNYQSITLFGIDRALNAGTERVIDHVATSMEEAEADFKDKLGTQIFSDGTGNGSKDLLGLYAVADDGTNVATYGGKTRTTDTWAQGGYTGSVGAISIADLQTAYRGARSGVKKPTLGVTTEAIFDDIEDLITPTTQNSISMKQALPADNFKGDNGMRGVYGFTELFYKGVPLVADEYCGSGRFFFLNTTRLKMRVLKNPVHGNTKTMGIAMTKMKEPVNQDGEVAQLLLYGELVCTEPRTQYQLNGIT